MGITITYIGYLYIYTPEILRQAEQNVNLIIHYSQHLVQIKRCDNAFRSSVATKKGNILHCPKL